MQWSCRTGITRALSHCPLDKMVRYLDVEIPIGFPMVTPIGAGSEVVDDDDPSLLRCPLVVEGSPESVQKLYRKFWEHRIWYKLTEINSSPDVMPEVGNINLGEMIQRLYRYNEDESDFSDGVDSVTIVYTKSREAEVVKQLAGFPPSISSTTNSAVAGARQAFHVQTRTGTKSLAVWEQCLDIEVPEKGIHLFLNNPDRPAWVVRTPKNRPPMLLRAQAKVLDKHAVSERAAWGKIESWLGSLDISACGEPYPCGENSFPDYKAWIKDIEYSVEMTSVPDMGKWTVKNTYRDLEKRVRELAREPSETIDEVIEQLTRVLQKKSARVKQVSSQVLGKGTLLVVSNWSSHTLAKHLCWGDQDLSAFEAVLLIELDGVQFVGGRHVPAR